ncbi:MAG: ATP-binding protein [Actinomycetota bacterium]|nr:ATP-binding protein [Actinomycetota bacterium]
MSTPNPENQATMVVRNGPLLGPVLSRVIGMLAARAQCPIDRLDDALLVADTVAAHGPDHARNGSVRVDLVAREGVIELTVGALRSNGAQRMLADAELPGVGNVLERVADAVEVRQDGEGEALYIRLGFSA